MAYRKTERERDRLRQRRDRIVVSACEVVQRSGFGAAKARTIAERAGVSVGSLYSNFDRVDELHAEVFQILAEEELRRVAEDVEAAGCSSEALAALVRGFGSRSLAAPVASWALLLEPVSANVEALRRRYRSDYADLVSSIVRAGIEAGELPRQSVAVSAPAFIGAISESLVRPLDHAGLNMNAGALIPGPEAGLIEEILAFCLRAIGADRPCTEPEHRHHRHETPVGGDESNGSE